MREDNVPSDCKSQARSAALPVAGGLEPLKRGESLVKELPAVCPVRRRLRSRSIHEAPLAELPSHGPRTGPRSRSGLRRPAGLRSGGLKARHGSGRELSAHPPASDASSQRLISIEARSKASGASEVVAPAAKDSVSVSMSCKAAMLSSISARWPSSATNSAWSLSRARGVRRSCEIAASIWVRSSTKRLRRPCMASNASWIAASSGIAGRTISVVSRSRPSLSAAAASAPSGATSPRAVTTAIAPMRTVPAITMASDRRRRLRAPLSLGLMVGQQTVPQVDGDEKQRGNQQFLARKDWALRPCRLQTRRRGHGCDAAQWPWSIKESVNGGGWAVGELAPNCRNDPGSAAKEAAPNAVAEFLVYADGKAAKPGQSFEEIRFGCSSRKRGSGEIGHSVAKPERTIERRPVLRGEQEHRDHQNLDRDHSRGDRKPDARGQSKPPEQVRITTPAPGAEPRS